MDKQKADVSLSPKVLKTYPRTLNCMLCYGILCDIGRHRKFALQTVYLLQCQCTVTW